MAETVVHDLEVVEIHEQHRTRISSPRGAAGGGFQLHEEFGAIREAGQRVVRRAVGEGCFGVTVARQGKCESGDGDHHECERHDCDHHHEMAGVVRQQRDQRDRGGERNADADDPHVLGLRCSGRRNRDEVAHQRVDGAGGEQRVAHEPPDVEHVTQGAAVRHRGQGVRKVGGEHQQESTGGEAPWRTLANVASAHSPPDDQCDHVEWWVQHGGRPVPDRETTRGELRIDEQQPQHEPTGQRVDNAVDQYRDVPPAGLSAEEPERSKNVGRIRSEIEDVVEVSESVVVE